MNSYYYDVFDSMWSEKYLDFIIIFFYLIFSIYNFLIRKLDPFILYVPIFICNFSKKFIFPIIEIFNINVNAKKDDSTINF